MNILVIGSDGFVGKNFCAQLENIASKKARWYKVDSELTIMRYGKGSTTDEFNNYCSNADFVFNFEGALLPSLLENLKKYKNTCPVMIGSSTPSVMEKSNELSPKEKEELMFHYAEDTGVKVLVYRFLDIFGKWCVPDEDNIVALLCHKIANDMPIHLDDPDVMLNLVYIDDVVDELIGALTGDEFKEGKYCYVPHVHKVRLGDMADLLYSFDEGRPSPNLQIPYVSDSFRKALYSTYTSYLPKEKISYPLEMKMDNRGSFTEFIHTENHGQVSININKPGITKGQHWHNNLIERFLVVSGHGLIQLRKEGVDENGQPYPVFNFEVNGEKLEVVEMIAGYTHNLINLSDTEDMVTVIWANACFDPNRPDTYFDPV